MQLTSSRVVNAESRVKKFDLSKAVKILGYKGWDRERIKAAETLYRKFLIIIALSDEGHRVIPPTEDVFTFWRVHHLQWMDYYEAFSHAGIRLVNPPLRRKPLIFRMGYERNLRETHTLWRLAFNEEPPCEECEMPHAALVASAEQE